MQIVKILLWFVAGIFWGVFLPATIVTLYSAIELQNTARAFYSPSDPEKKPLPLARSDPRLATLQTVALIRKLDAEKESETLDALDRELLRTRPASLNARNEVRFAAIGILARHGEKDPTGQCTAPPETQIACFTDAKDAACLADWTLIKKCYDRAFGFWNATPEDAKAVREMERLMGVARHATEHRNDLVALWPSADKLRKETLYPVAESLRQAATRPLLLAAFVMPQGILVACFTSVMAVLGAGVASLMKVYRYKVSSNSALKGFLVAPLLGGLTGFMVFFVVSAGTSVLVQPSPVDASQPISNLSAPALASLGVLAGLAAEQAIAWLQKKAMAFFSSPDAPEPPARGKTETA